MINHVTH